MLSDHQLTIEFSYLLADVFRRRQMHQTETGTFFFYLTYQTGVCIGL